MRPQTASLHKAIVSILDLCMIFCHSCATSGADVPVGASRLASSTTRRPRSKRLRRQNRDIISFTSHVPLYGADSGSSDSDADELDIRDESFFPVADESYSGDNDILGRISKISSDLDGLVRFVRRGVENLQNASTRSSPSFDIFAFALQDWDL